MELDRVKILVDKYLEAETTLAEERELAEYFTTAESIPEEYLPIKAMFTSVAAIREQKAPLVARPKERKRVRWSLIGGVSAAVAAACLIIMLVTPQPSYEIPEVRMAETQPAPQPEIICYIDGVKITDQGVAYAEANKILGGVSTNMQLAMAHIDKYNIINNK